MVQPQSFITEDEYLARERASAVKHEYYAGVVYAMAGASERHNLIAMNLAALLRTHLRGRGCRAYPSDMRLKVMQTGLNTYPDFTIVCGSSRFTDEDKRDTLTNPIVIIEILSPSTEAYDRGMKFQHYRTIETLQEYILVAQNKAHIERFTRKSTNEWVFSEAIGLESFLALSAVDIQLSLEAIYEDVSLGADIYPLHSFEQEASVPTAEV